MANTQISVGVAPVRALMSRSSATMSYHPGNGCSGHVDIIITYNETGSRSPCMRPSSDPPKMKNSTQTTLLHFNFSVMAELHDVTRRLIILINEEINEANWMVSNSAKLDCRTKQHTQFGVSMSDSSRDMARTKSWRKKKEKKEKKNEREQNHIVSPTGIANN